jgi:flagellar basal body-associated protein FliL
MAAEEKAPKADAPETPKASGTKKIVMIAGIAGGVLILNVVGLVFLFKSIGKTPSEAEARENPVAETHDQVETPDEKTVEVSIANQFECSHTNTGRQYIIRMTIFAAVPKNLVKEKSGEKEKKEAEKEGKAAGDEGIQAEIERHLATIKDRMRTVIASADASTLCLARSEKPDYGLSTLRRQFKTILDDVLGKGKVKDVLISDYMPSPMD